MLFPWGTEQAGRRGTWQVAGNGGVTLRIICTDAFENLMKPSSQCPGESTYTELASGFRGRSPCVLSPCPVPVALTLPCFPHGFIIICLSCP